MESHRSDPLVHFLQNWIVATVIGAALDGLLYTGIILIASPAAEWLVTVGGFVGVFVGIAQASVLRRVLSRRSGWWIPATIAGFATSFVGVAQWLVLRGQVSSAGWWAVIGTLSWWLGIWLASFANILFPAPLPWVSIGLIGGAIAGLPSGYWLRQQLLQRRIGAGALRENK